MKKLFTFLFLLFAVTQGAYAGCNGQTCQYDGASASGMCAPEPVGSGKTGNNNWNCCHGYPSDGANYQAAGCQTFCTDQAYFGTAMCETFYGAPINRGLILLLLAGLSTGGFVLFKREKKAV